MNGDKITALNGSGADNFISLDSGVSGAAVHNTVIDSQIDLTNVGTHDDIAVKGKGANSTMEHANVQLKNLGANDAISMQANVVGGSSNDSAVVSALNQGSGDTARIVGNFVNTSGVLLQNKGNNDLSILDGTKGGSIDINGSNDVGMMLPWFVGNSAPSLQAQYGVLNQLSEK